MSTMIGLHPQLTKLNLMIKFVWCSFRYLRLWRLAQCVSIKLTELPCSCKNNSVKNEYCTTLTSGRASAWPSWAPSGARANQNPSGPRVFGLYEGRGRRDSDARGRRDQKKRLCKEFYLTSNPLLFVWTYPALFRFELWYLDYLIAQDVSVCAKFKLIVESYEPLPRKRNTFNMELSYVLSYHRGLLYLLLLTRNIISDPACCSCSEVAREVGGLTCGLKLELQLSDRTGVKNKHF